MPKMGEGIEEFTRGFTNKVQKGVLPPDPARVIVEGLREGANLEHVSPLPPLIERVQKEFTEPGLKELPRLPLTSDFPVREWMTWKEE